MSRCGVSEYSMSMQYWSKVLKINYLVKTVLLLVRVLKISYFVKENIMKYHY